MFNKPERFTLQYNATVASGLNTKSTYLECEANGAATAGTAAKVTVKLSGASTVFEIIVTTAGSEFVAGEEVIITDTSGQTPLSVLITNLSSTDATNLNAGSGTLSGSDSLMSFHQEELSWCLYSNCSCLLLMQVMELEQNVQCIISAV